MLLIEYDDKEINPYSMKYIDGYLGRWIDRQLSFLIHDLKLGNIKYLFRNENWSHYNDEDLKWYYDEAWKQIELITFKYDLRKFEFKLYWENGRRKYIGTDKFMPLAEYYMDRYYLCLYHNNEYIGKTEYYNSSPWNRPWDKIQWEMRKHLFSRLKDEFNTRLNILYQAKDEIVKYYNYLNQARKQIEKKATNNNSYVYFIGNKKEGIVKIGHTTRNPEKRLADLQTYSPFKLFLLGFAIAKIDAEKKYHRKFNKYRKHGEWFFLSEDIKREIQCLKN
jgi:hypothetical protein